MHDNYSLGSGNYAEIAIRLHALADSSNDPEAAAELRELAGRYERLAAKSALIHDKYLPLDLEAMRDGDIGH